MREFQLPYGICALTFKIDDRFPIDLIVPNDVTPCEDELACIQQAVNLPMGDIHPFEKLIPSSKVVITVNDKTRPVPNNVLTPPLLAKIHHCGVPAENITFIIASGTHVPMDVKEYSRVLPAEIIAKYRVIVHDCDQEDQLEYIGNTSSGTPVYVNRVFLGADLRIVVGDIEPHHFAGFSGGVKSAAIGLCGRKTINANHTLLMHPNSKVGEFENNPLRQDIEQIGSMINVDLALNAILDDQKRIISAFFGRPLDVVKAGIEVAKQMAFIPIKTHYDVVIASAGGFPKDINLYQAQKAMTHASMFCKEHGKVILAAQCIEGVGSQSYLEFMDGLLDNNSVFEKFKKEGFTVGPHKAYQIARILERVNVYLFSDISSSIVKKLLLSPVAELNDQIDEILEKIPENANIAILPFATATIPFVMKDIQ